MTIAQTLRLRDQLYESWRPIALLRCLADVEVLDASVVLFADRCGLDDGRVRADLLAWPKLEIPLVEAELRRLSLWFASLNHDGRRRILRVPPIPPSTIELVGVQIQDWRYGEVFQGDRRIALELLVLHGCLSGTTFWRSLSSRFLWVMSQDLAFGRRRRWSGMAGDLVSMWLFIELQADARGRPWFERYRVPSSCRTHNRALVKARQEACPFNHPWACAQCPIGHDQCPRGTHALTFPKRTCYAADRGPRPVGQTVSHWGWVDPQERSAQCVECRLGHQAGTAGGDHVSASRQ